MPVTAGDPTDDKTVWVIVKHTRFPFVSDEVIGSYPSREEAYVSLNAYLANRQWFSEYSVEHRAKI